MENDVKPQTAVIVGNECFDEIRKDRENLSEKPLPQILFKLTMAFLRSCLHQFEFPYFTPERRAADT